MDPSYENINSFSNDLDNLWKNKNDFGSVSFSEEVSIEEGNYCSDNNLSPTRSTVDDINVYILQSMQRTTICENIIARPMSLIDRLKKTSYIWILPDLTRKQTEKILEDVDPGIFIVRMNADKTFMVLSFKVIELTQHIMIKINAQRGFYLDGSEHVFRSLNHMIAHFMKNTFRSSISHVRKCEKFVPVISTAEKKTGESVNTEVPQVLESEYLEFGVFKYDSKLKLPRALMEAHDVAHFQFFENMKINFWTTGLVSKSINDIWSKQIHDSRTEVKTDNTGLEDCPPVPPRGYNVNELNMLQGQVDACDIEDVFDNIC